MKRILLVLAVIVLVVLFFIMTRPDKQPEAKKSDHKETESQASSQKEKTEIKPYYTNTEGLYFLNADGVEDFKAEFEAWIKTSGIRAKDIEVYEKVEENTEQELIEPETLITSYQRIWMFYLILDDEASFVKGQYNENDFAFSFVDKLPEVPVEQPEENEPTQNEQKNVNESYAPNIENEDVGDLVISNPDTLADVANEMALNQAVTEYLTAQGEYRREVTVDKVVMEESSIEISLKFKNPRIDRKNIHVSMTNQEYLVTWSED